MAKIEPPNPARREEIEFRRTVLDPIKVAARASLSPQLANDLDVRTYQDALGFMADRLILELRTYVYAAPVGEIVERVPFEKRETVVERRSLEAPIMATLVAGCAAAIAGPWISAVVFAIGILILVVLAQRVSTREIVASGVVELRVDVKDSFPDNTMVYPGDLGQPRRIILPSSPSIIWDDDQRL